MPPRPPYCAAILAGGVFPGTQETHIKTVSFDQPPQNEQALSREKELGVQQMKIWLVLIVVPVVVVVAVVSGPLGSTAMVHLEPEQNGGEKEKTAAANGGMSCLEEQKHHRDAQQSFLLALRDALGKGTELRREELAQFGFCSQSSGAEHQLPWFVTWGEKQQHQEGNDHEVLPTTKDHWDVNGDGEFTLTLHFGRTGNGDQPTTMAFIILLFFVDSSNTKLNVTFSSHTLQPNKQTLCFSKGTQFLLLTGGQAEGFSHGHLELKMVVETLNDSGQKIGLSELQAVMMRKDHRSRIALKPVVIFFLDKHISDRGAPRPNGQSSRTFFFLCELQKFLKEVFPHKDPPPTQDEDTEVAHDILQSLPPLSLGVSSSESLLLELVNSSGPTVFSFPQQSLGLRSHHVELALNPSLLAMLRWRLDEALAQVKREEAGQRLIDRLKILTDLSALPDDRENTGTGLEKIHEVQYRALLLLKALQTVLGAWAAERVQRAARAGQEGPSIPTECRLQSLIVSLEKYLLDPPSANINNCEGVCGFPLNNITSNNHAFLLNSHIQSGQPLNRLLCCVPVNYDSLAVIEVTSEGTTISYKPNMVAKECECR